MIKIEKSKLKKLSPIFGGIFAIFIVLLIFYYKTDFLFLSRISTAVEDFSVRVAAKDIQNKSIAIVDIDEASIREYGQWPWSRIYLSEMVHSLNELGAKVIAFDILFAEPDRTSPSQISKLYQIITPDTPLDKNAFENIPDFDDVFSEAIKAHAKVVLGVAFHLEESSENSSFQDPLYLRRWVNSSGDTTVMPSQIFNVSNAVLPIQKLRKAAGRNVGLLSTTPDFDRVIRRTPMIVQAGEKMIYPALSVEAVRLFKGRRNNIYSLNQKTGAIDSVNIYDMDLHVDDFSTAVINYRKNQFPTFSVKKILNGEVDKKDIEGKIVFVGTSAAGLFDLVNTPIGENLSGVTIHAIVADNILAGDLLHTTPKWQLLIIVLGIVAAFLALINSVPIGLILATILAIFAFFFSVWLRQTNYATSPFEPIVVIYLSYALTTFFRFILADKQRKAVRAMFGSMVSPEVLKHLENKPTHLNGEYREVSVLFTDLEGFTAISEKLKPEELSQLLHDYFTPMTDICLKYGAYINKFIGDAIMAVYNVPTDLQNHADAAVNSAIEMQKKLAEMRPIFYEKFGITVNMRIGIHTGTAIAGNMGSKQRFEYTVLGDTVNLASRLESENKKHNSWILISQNTKDALNSVCYDFRDIGEIYVRNRLTPINVYEILTKIKEEK